MKTVYNFRGSVCELGMGRKSSRKQDTCNGFFKDDHYSFTIHKVTKNIIEEEYHNPLNSTRLFSLKLTPDSLSFSSISSPRRRSSLVLLCLPSSDGLSFHRRDLRGTQSPSFDKGTAIFEKVIVTMK